jgi:hypothetical protein
MWNSTSRDLMTGGAAERNNSQYRVNGSKETGYEPDDSDSPGDYLLGHFEQLVADRNSSLLHWRFRDY